MRRSSNRSALPFSLGIGVPLLNTHYCIIYAEINSSHEKPVAYGLAIQALLDTEVADEDSDSHKKIEGRGSAGEENLAEYVARDLKVAIGTDTEEEQPTYNLAEEVVIAAGVPKTELWEKGVERSISLQRRLKRQLKYAFFSDHPVRAQEQDKRKRPAVAS